MHNDLEFLESIDALHLLNEVVRDVQLGQRVARHLLPRATSATNQLTVMMMTMTMTMMMYLLQQSQNLS